MNISGKISVILLATSILTPILKATIVEGTDVNWTLHLILSSLSKSNHPY